MFVVYLFEYNKYINLKVKFFINIIYLMMKNKKLLSSNQQFIQKTFNQYQINLIPKLNSILISIYQKNNHYLIFESDFTLKYLHSFKLLVSNFTIDEIMKFICSLIERNNIKIEENQSSLKIILISHFPNQSNVELVLNYKDILSIEVLENLRNKLKYIENENKLLNGSLKKEITKLNIKSNLFEKENKFEKEENISLRELINKNENKIKEYKYIIKETENRIIKIEKINILKNKQFRKIKFIKVHNNKDINRISIFPSGKIISISDDKSINIYDDKFNNLQQINNAHSDKVIYIDIKDEDNFVTCSSYNNIKTWIKVNNQFINNRIIHNAHDDNINKVIYYLNEDLISCSSDHTIKIWEMNNNYQNILKLTHSDEVYSILLLKDKNNLISGAKDGIKFWNLYNFELIIYLNNISYYSWDAFCRINDDKIIVCESKNDDSSVVYIVSIFEKKIVKTLNLNFFCFGINIIEDKDIFLIGGFEGNIRIYSIYNFENIQNINKTNDGYILGFIELKDETILSYGKEGLINIWSFAN